MLVLKRKIYQTIRIGTGENAATIRIMEIKGRTVSLAIEAPKAVKILRGELDENTEAA